MYRGRGPIPPVFAGIGIQPNHVAEAGPGDWDAVVKLAGPARSSPSARRGWTGTGIRAVSVAGRYFARHLALAPNEAAGDHSLP